MKAIILEKFKGKLDAAKKKRGVSANPESNLIRGVGRNELRLL